jgi:hypothetical protein
MSKLCVVSLPKVAAPLEGVLPEQPVLLVEGALVGRDVEAVAAEVGQRVGWTDLVVVGWRQDLFLLKRG